MLCHFAVPIAHKALIDLKGVHYEEDEFPEGSGYRFVRTPDREGDCLTSKEKDILNKVIQVCGKDTKEQIVTRMHQETAYKKTLLGDVISYQYALELSVD